MGRDEVVTKFFEDSEVGNHVMKVLNLRMKEFKILNLTPRD
jgi:hypothetical protein